MSRPRLLSALERCQNYRLLLISAGTGFGKTTLLTDFARISQLGLAWYALDERDRDPAVFCRYLLQSVRLVYPSFGASFEHLLEQNLKELHQETIIYRLAEEFIAELEALRQNTAINFRPTLLVLDDFQFAESFSVNRFVQRLLWWLPQDFHVIIATRALPEDLMLNKMLAKQMMTTLSSRDLAFTAEEVNQLLSDFYSIEDNELAGMLAQYSEGWITAIVLALSGQNFGYGDDSSLQKLKAANQNFDPEQVFNYLAQEVLDNQTPEIQEFLVRTSVLDILSPNICGALLDAEIEPGRASEHSRSETLLKQLESRNLFITRLSDHNGQISFQYHALFRQFLRTKLKQNKALYEQIQLRAAQAQREAGNFIEAIQHYVAAGEVVEAALLLNEVAEGFYEAGRMGLLNQLLESIPAEQQNKLAHLLNIKAQLLLEKGSNEAAIRTFAQAEQLYEKEQAHDRAAKASARQAQLLVRTGQRREAHAACSRILRDYTTLMQTPEGQIAVAFAKHVLGIVAIEESNTTEAENNLRDAAELYKAHQDDFRLAAIDSVFGELYHRTGRLTKSNIYHERALSYFIKIGNRSREAYCRTSLAINRYLQGQYQQAEAQLNETLALTEDLNDTYLRLFGLTYLANIYRDTDHYTRADTVYNEALELAREGGIRKMELSLLNERITNFILMGKKEEVRSLIQLSLDMSDEYNLPERKAFSYRNRSWLEQDNRSYKRALTNIEDAIHIFSSTKNQLEEARAKLTSATILLAMGEPRKALATLSESLEMVEDLGYEPYLPFELRWASALFEHATKKKVSETVTDFLRRRGFISGLESLAEAGSAREIEMPVNLPKPIQFTPRREVAGNRSSNDEYFTKKSTTSTARMQVYALNGGRVWCDNVEVEKWRTSKVREALFYLLENPRCTRDQLWEALWPDEDFGTSPNLLNANLSYLRKTLGAGVELKLSSGRYSLEGEIWYDAAEFNTQLQTALAPGDFNPERLAKALTLYKRDFLDQFYSNWILERQQQLQQLYLTGLERLASYYDAQNQPQLALPYWRQILLKDEYNEEAHRACIACLISLGNKTEARRQSDQCLKALEELDLQPSPETTRLLKKLA